MTGLPTVQAAQHLGIDAATLRKWRQQGCPVVKRGGKGPGNGALYDVHAVQVWRGKTVKFTDFTPDIILRQVAEALRLALTDDHADLRAGISREAAAAALLVAWERCCKTFGKTYPFDQQPDPIRALGRVL